MCGACCLIQGILESRCVDAETAAREINYTVPQVWLGEDYRGRECGVRKKEKFTVPTVATNYYETEENDINLSNKVLNKMVTTAIVIENDPTLSMWLLHIHSVCSNAT